MCIKTGNLPSSRAALPLWSAHTFNFDISKPTPRLHQMFCHEARVAGWHQARGTQIKTRKDPSAFNMWSTRSRLHRSSSPFAPKKGGSGTSEQLSEQQNFQKLGGKSTLLPRKTSWSGLLPFPLSLINAFLLYQHLFHICALFTEKSAHNSTLPGFPEREQALKVLGESELGFRASQKDLGEKSSKE